MLLLQDEYRQQLIKLDNDIEALYARLTPLKIQEDYVTFEKKLKEHLEEYGKSILLKKKYWRDKNAFGEGRAYRWNQEKKYPKKNLNKNRDYLSDTPSNSSSSVSSLTDYQFQKRKGSFSKQNEIEGHVQQVNKNVPQKHSH